MQNNARHAHMHVANWMIRFAMCAHCFSFIHNCYSSSFMSWIYLTGFNVTLCTQIAAFSVHSHTQASTIDDAIAIIVECLNIFYSLPLLNLRWTLSNYTYIAICTTNLHHYYDAIYLNILYAVY